MMERRFYDKETKLAILRVAEKFHESDSDEEIESYYLLNKGSLSRWKKEINQCVNS